jgi:uncharacterized phiE125 gp8 family phage protein
MSRYRSLKRLTDPAVEPVTLAEAKLHLRVEHSDDDALISASIQAAREWVEEYLDATLIHTQWVMTLDLFPPAISLPRPRMAEADGFTAVELTYTIDTGAVVTLPTSDYRVDRDSVPGVLRPNYGDSWPAHLADYNAISVTWWAGFGADGSAVPQRIRNAVLMLVTHYYEQRSAVLVGQGVISKPIEFGVRSLLDSARWGGYA